MTSKHSIVQLETFVKVLCSKNPSCGDEVLSRNPDGTSRTVWGLPLFRPSGAVIYTHHPDKPHRRRIGGPSLPAVLQFSTPYRKEWVTDERWHNPAIRLEFKLSSYDCLPGSYVTYACVFCFDTFHDDAGVCHWIIDTLYVDVFGLEDIIFPGEYGGRWNLSHKEATLWVEEMVRFSQSDRVDTTQVGRNLFTDSPTPLIWGPPLISGHYNSRQDFEILLWDLRWATRGVKYAIIGPNPSRMTCAEIVLSIDKVTDSQSRYWGHGCIINIEFLLEVQANVRKIILTKCSFRHQ